MEVLYSMKVIELSLRLTRLNPMFDSIKSKDDEGNVCRKIFIELRNGKQETLVEVNETEEGTYNTDFKGFNLLSKKKQEELVSLVEEYCASPVELRLAK